MAQPEITERQSYWRDHVLAAAAHEGSIVEYAAANNLKTKDLYQWKTALTRRGFLPKADTGQPASEFAEVNVASASPAAAISDGLSAHCRLTLPCGSVLEYFNPIEPASIARLLASLRS